MKQKPTDAKKFRFFNKNSNPQDTPLLSMQFNVNIETVPANFKWKW
jgi:hypothetical protein